MNVKYIVIDNFYDNPMEVREFALKQEYYKNNLPRFTSKSNFITKDIVSIFQKIIQPYGGKIIHFDYKDSGTFHYSTSEYIEWTHSYSSSWVAIIYLTPNAPVTCGTSFYRFNDGSMKANIDLNKYKNFGRENNCDVTKWDSVDDIGNIFNRLIIYDSDYFHRETNYFGNDIHDGSLFQTFFFTTEKI